MVKAIKKAENSNEIVVRLQELTGAAQTATLSFAAPILSARQVTGAEDAVAHAILDRRAERAEVFHLEGTSSRETHRRLAPKVTPS